MLLFVNANDLAWTGALAPDEEGNDGRAVYLKSCANCHRDDRRGTPPQIPALVNLAGRFSPQALTTIIRQGVGRMPGFADLSAEALAALVAYLQTETDHAPDDRPRHNPRRPVRRRQLANQHRSIGLPATKNFSIQMDIPPPRRPGAHSMRSIWPQANMPGKFRLANTLSS